jgi:hypothetical protein
MWRTLRLAFWSQPPPAAWLSRVAYFIARKVTRWEDFLLSVGHHPNVEQLSGSVYFV